jgi:hypothetical protein
MNNFCTHCGASISDDSIFCDACGHRIEREKPGEAGSPAPSPDSRPGSVTWLNDIPLLTSRFTLFDMLKVVVLSPSIMCLLVFVMFLIVGDMEFGELLRFLGFAFVIGCGALVVLLTFVMLVFYRNRFPCKFTAGPEGAGLEMNPRQKKLNRTVVVLGALAGRANVAGAGLLAYSQESVSMRWGDVYHINFHPGQRVISLMNTWRTVIRLHCTPENYEDVARICVEGFESAAASRARSIAERQEWRAAFKKRIVAGLPWAVLSIIGSLMIGLSPLLDNPGYAFALLAMSAVASLAGGVWRRLLGAASLAVFASILLMVLARGSEVHTDIFGLVRTSGFDLAMKGGDQVPFALSVFGMMLVMIASLRNMFVATRPDLSSREAALQSKVIGVGLVLLVVASSCLVYWKTQSAHSKPELQTVEIRSFDPMPLREFKAKYNAMIEKMRIYNKASGDLREDARADFEKAQREYDLALQRIKAEGSEIEKHSAGLIDQAYNLWMRMQRKVEAEP